MDPRTPPPMRFTEMEPDNFELLVFRLAWLEDRTVLRPNAPDGGLDVVRPDPERLGKALHGWQAKRHTGAIDWRDCEKSLDRAVGFWEPRSVTFVFPRDLTGGEHQTFVRQLGARHAGVNVDYWGASVLRARLDTDEAKRIVAQHFDPDPFERAERLLRANSPLKSVADFLSADAAIGDTIAEASADYDWYTQRRPVGRPDPPMTPGAVLRVSLEHKGTLVYADLVPLHGAGPSMVLRTDDTPAGRQARAWLDELVRLGGRLALRDGVSVDVSDVPPPYGELFGAPLEGKIVIRVTRTPAALFVTLVSGAAETDVDLQPAVAPDDWDAELAGTRGGLYVRLRFRHLVEKGRAQSELHFDYHEGQAPHELEAEVQHWLIAMLETGVVELRDRRGERPPLSQSRESAPVPDWLTFGVQLHEACAEIERAAGRPVPPIPKPPRDAEVRGVLEAAHRLRARHFPLRARDVSFTGDDVAARVATPIIRDFTTAHTVVLHIFGAQIPVARQIMRLPPMLVRERIRVSQGWRLELEPLHAAEADVMAEWIPMVEHEPPS